MTRNSPQNKTSRFRVSCGLRNSSLRHRVRAASGNNGRLSSSWREVISVAGIARPFSKTSSSLNRRFCDPGADHDERSRAQWVDMRSNDVI
ncbi:hypothetical protein BJS_00857 [Bradyrhizobium japonicum SEMIA 5079]|nr:hypothetical protein BJS_00857 [Bradyrhizobium japonicum SEMIA 5079]